MPGVITPFEHPDAYHVYHLYVIQVAGDRDAVLSYLHEQGIGAGIHYPTPVHLQPALAKLGYQAGDFPKAEAAARSIISLPIYPELTQEQVARVAQAVGEATRIQQHA
jgi:dTDP-4-amino-4,6-dideoxygalactose transaminase